MTHSIKKVIFPFIAAILILSQTVGHSTAKPAQATSNGTCRFGITSVHGTDGYDIASIGVGSYLDWGADSHPSLPAGMQYIRTLRVREDLYANTLANLNIWVNSHPGSVWLVGNEPDTTYGGQDALTPEVYADRFYDLASQIRSLDPTAKIGFGTIVQPTPIRMRYLDRAWSRLITLAKTQAAASALIDIWSIHSFILNEWPYQWGTGVPPGFESDYLDAIVITNFAETYSIAKFQQRIIAFRAWMTNKGERNKPLWITEYGSLFPPIDPPGINYVNVSDQNTTNYMLATFNYLLGATDPNTGLISDGNRLVQRWFWYSLNDHRYNYGGTIFDPDNGKTETLVGQSFKNYQALTLAQPDLSPINLTLFPTSNLLSRTLVNYQLRVTIGNDLSADTGSTGKVWIYNGNPDEGGILIAGPISSSVIPKCGGHSTVSTSWLGVLPGQSYTLYVVVKPIGVSDSNPGNDQVGFDIYTELPELFFLPIITK